MVPVQVGIVIAISLAGIVLATATIPLLLRVPHRQNRGLALVLGIEAVILLMFIGGAIHAALAPVPWTPAPEWAQDLSVLVTAGMISAYLAFISTLQTPLVRWLRSRLVLALLIAYPVVMYTLKLTYVEDYAPTPSTLDVITFFGLIGVLVTSHLYCLAASIDAWRRAQPSTVQKVRMKAFAVAFGTRDAMLLTVLAVWLVLGFGPESPVSSYVWAWWAPIGVPLSFLAYLVLLTYGILKTQLFDIDIRIRKGVKATTLTLFFVVTFFVAEQLGQSIISERAGPYVGFAGAGLLAVAIEPLRRVADRIANKTVPGATESAEYIAQRKTAVYRAALEGAYEDGDITPKERTMLTRLAAELSLHPDEMSAIEHDVVRTRVGAPKTQPEATPS